MEQKEIIEILLYGIWFPAIAGFLIYFATNYFKTINKRKYEKYFLRDKHDEDRYALKEINYTIEKSLDEFRSFIPKIIESTLENQISLTNKITKSELQEIQKSISNINIVQSDFKGKSLTIPDDNGKAQLMRELSHSLNTPISQIETAVLNLNLEAAKYTKIDKEFPDIINSMKISVDLCKSIIAAYRELILIIKSSTVWNPESLNSIIDSAIIVYSQQNNKTFSVSNNLPDTIDGYSNNYLTSLLLPLIENAVEDGVPNTQIELNSIKTNKNLQIEISNISKTIPDDKIYKDSYSTKANHTGTGLSIVQHLLKSHSGSKLIHKCSNDKITFIINLPIK